MNIINIKEATNVSGGKASGLALLDRIGVPVPPGFVINSSEELTFTNEEQELIEAFLSNLDPTKRLAVRSSALAEDGKSQSFAGIFETVLNVNNNIRDVIEAIKKVNESASSDIVKAYTANERQKMNIVIQEMVTPKIAGVMFTKAIDINGDDVALFECVSGLADKLVSGSVIPARVIIKLENRKLNQSETRTEGPLIDLSNLCNIFPFVDKIWEVCEKPLDIEWCIDENGNPYFVQARPITSDVFIMQKLGKNGIVASRGYAEGEAYVIDESLDSEEIKKLIDNFPEGAILVAGITETLYMPAIKKAKGIITEEGSALSHAAIVSRELGIPCIAGYKNAIKLFPTGSRLILDASNGKITSNGVENVCDQNKSFEFGELYCFDNVTCIDFQGTKVFFESTYDGLAVHMASDDVNPKLMNEVEIYARKTFKTSPKQFLDDKYLWYFEIERFKTLPYFNEINEYVSELVEKKDCNELNNFYENMLSKLSELVKYRDTQANDFEKIIIGEIGAYFNLILDATLPLGYALRKCYLDSLSPLKEVRHSFNDLVSNNITECNQNGILNTIQQFLNCVSKNRNDVYEKICEIGGTNPEYFDERDEKVAKVLASRKITNSDNIMEEFYSVLEPSDFAGILSVFGSNDFYKKKSESRGCRILKTQE